jgi:hypothetical protein
MKKSSTRKAPRGAVASKNPGPAPRAFSREQFPKMSKLVDLLRRNYESVGVLFPVSVVVTVSLKLFFVSGQDLSVLPYLLRIGTEIYLPIAVLFIAYLLFLGVSSGAIAMLFASVSRWYKLGALVVLLGSWFIAEKVFHSTSLVLVVGFSSIVLWGLMTLQEWLESNQAEKISKKLLGTCGSQDTGANDALLGRPHRFDGAFLSFVVILFVMPFLTVFQDDTALLPTERITLENGEVIVGEVVGDDNYGLLLLRGKRVSPAGAPKQTPAKPIDIVHIVRWDTIADRLVCSIDGVNTWGAPSVLRLCETAE